MGISIAGPVRRVIALAVAASLVAGLAAAPVYAGADPQPNTVALSGTLTAAHVGQSVVLTATATGQTPMLELWDAVDGGTSVKIAEQAPALVDTLWTATFTVNDLALGSHAFGAASVADASFLAGTSAPWIVAVTKMPTSIDITPLAPPVGGQSFGATVTLKQTDPEGPATGATGDATVTEGTIGLGSCALASGSCTVNLTLAAGSHTLTVSYAGDAKLAAATHDVTWNVPVRPIGATGVGLNYKTFYPVKDGYRDSVKARGTRSEPLSVTIKVYSPSGSKLKTVRLPSGTGAYAWSWNGRNASGTIYPAGKYRITQKLARPDKTSRTWTTYVTLSRKRLYTYTKTLTQSYPDQVDYSDTGWAGWKFTLPSATVYKKIVFGADARSNLPAGRFGPQDYTVCTSAYVGPACTSLSKALPRTRAWTNLTGSVSKNIKSGRARIFMWSNGARVYPYRVHVVVTYGVLK